MTEASTALQTGLPAQLSDSESVTLELMLTGCDRNQIVKQTGLAMNTVRANIYNINRKLGSRDRAIAKGQAIIQNLPPLVE